MNVSGGWEDRTRTADVLVGAALLGGALATTRGASRWFSVASALGACGLALAGGGRRQAAARRALIAGTLPLLSIAGRRSVAVTGGIAVVAALWAFVTREIQDRDLSPSFVALLAHELRGPLAAIRGATALLAQHGSAVDDARRQDLLDVADDAAAQLNRIVDDVLVAARLDRGTLPIEPVPFDLARLVRDEARAYGSLDGGRPITVIAQDDLPMAYGDPVRMRQVVGNLMRNAVAHATERSIVIVSITREDGHLRCAFYNDGSGVDKAQRSRLFLPFSSPAPRPETTGLGLYLAKALVEAMDGHIDMASPGKNAIFYFSIPHSRAASSA